MRGKEERGKDGEEKMKVRAGSLINQLFSWSWLYLEKKNQGWCFLLACDTISLPQCLTEMSRTVERRKLPCCHFLKLQSKNRYW